MLLNCAEYNRLSAKKLDSNTFVFWAEPDQNKIARAALRGEGFGVEPGIESPDAISQQLRTELGAPALPPPLVESGGPLNRLFNGQLEYGGARRLVEAPGSVLTTKMSRLSPGLQRKLVPFFIAEKLKYASKSRGYNELWLRDEVWQRATLGLTPANSVVHTPPELVLLAQFENGQNRMQLYLFPLWGAMSADVMRTKRGGPPLPLSAPLEAGQLRVLPLKGDPASVPAILNDVTWPAGSGFKSLQVASANGVAQEQVLAQEKPLETLVSLDAMRRPLSELLRDAGRGVGVDLKLDSELEAKTPLISAHVQAMSLAQLMQAVSQTYGANWVKEDAQAWTLKPSGRSDFEMELLRVGDPRYYRFRDISYAAHIRKKEQAAGYAAGVLAQVGNSLTVAPGVAFTSLPVPLQQEIRERATAEMARRVLEQQVMARDLLAGEWSLQISGGTLPQSGPAGGMSFSSPNLSLLVDDTPRQRVSWFGLVPNVMNNPAPSKTR